MINLSSEEFFRVAARAGVQRRTAEKLYRQFAAEGVWLASGRRCGCYDGQLNPGTLVEELESPVRSPIFRCTDCRRRGPEKAFPDEYPACRCTAQCRRRKAWPSECVCSCQVEQYGEPRHGDEYRGLGPSVRGCPWRGLPLADNTGGQPGGRR